MTASDVFNVISRYYSSEELLWFASSISRFHRVQGCKGLEEAAEFMRRDILDLKNFEVKVQRFSYSRVYGLHSDIVGWEVKDGFTELLHQNRVLSSFLEAKTAVVVHSPGGDVESGVVYVGNGLDLESYKGAEDKIVLSYGSPYLVYKIGCKLGIAGFIFFRRNVHEKAIPYAGLFLSRDELKECKAPATTISKEDAMRIIDRLEKGDKVKARIYVEANYRVEAYAPVVEASLGDGESEIHMYAHMCHPGGTVNDNVSGVAALLELVNAMDRAIVKGDLSPPTKRRLVFVFFPEYYGSLPYLMDKAEKNTHIDFSINLDMIGEKQWLTNSTLYFIRPPHVLSKPYCEAVTLKLLMYALAKHRTFSTVFRTNSYRFDVVPYDSGSDHDIYLQFGVPSIMLNQWPDIFYHSNMDTIDKFDAEVTKDIAVGVGTGVHLLASEVFKDKIVKIVSDAYVDFVKSYSNLKQLDFDGKPLQSVEEDVVYTYIAPKGVISVRLMVARLGLEKAIEVAKKLSEDTFMNHLTTRYIPLQIMLKPCTIKEIVKQIAVDYVYNPNIGDIKQTLSYLEALGVVSA